MSNKMFIYLDFLRVFMVLFLHLSFSKFSGNLINFSFGHEAVMIFFVLSGYVIASILFELYSLFYYLLLFVYISILDTNYNISYLKLVSLVFLIIGLLVYISEYKKYRYKIFFNKLLNKVIN